MVASLTAMGFALRAGLRLRRARRRRLRPPPGTRALHLRFAKPAVAAIGLGFLAGPVSMLALRDRPPFETLHGVLALVVVGLFGATAWLGRRLELGRSGARDAHAALGVLALLFAAAAAVAGFVLLP